MHLLYLDDSGSVKNKHEDYFVLGGLSISEHNIRWMNYELEKLALKIYPIAPRQVEFHASEIFRGKTIPWTQFSTKQDRIQIIKDVLKILQNAYQSVVVFACAIHKNSYPSDDPVMLAFEDLSSRFDLYLSGISTEDNKQKGLIVLDKSSHETSLQNLAKEFREKGNKWGSYLKNICEVSLFVDSKASRIIQLADHIAYAVFRRYNAGDLNYFNCIEGHFDSYEGIIHGLAHKQNYKPICTCPACITRRNP